MCQPIKTINLGFDGGNTDGFGVAVEHVEDADADALVCDLHQLTFHVFAVGDLLDVWAVEGGHDSVATPRAGRTQ